MAEKTVKVFNGSREVEFATMDEAKAFVERKEREAEASGQKCAVRFVKGGEKA